MMTIKQIEVTVGQIAEGYVNNEELGVRGYGGRLDIRPAHQHDPNANNLWTYFQNVINWAMTNFELRKFRRIMKGLDWAQYYDRYHGQTLDTVAMAKRISAASTSAPSQRT